MKYDDFNKRREEKLKKQKEKQKQHSCNLKEAGKLKNNSKGKPH
ncbi:hypothetical protein [Natribacillus halophilus]|nr:hypothetical protein [Natribacillus halophilus]